MRRWLPVLLLSFVSPLAWAGEPGSPFFDRQFLGIQGLGQLEQPVGDNAVLLPRLSVARFRITLKAGFTPGVLPDPGRGVLFEEPDPAAVEALIFQADGARILEQDGRGVTLAYRAPYTPQRRLDVVTVHVECADSRFDGLEVPIEVEIQPRSIREAEVRIERVEVRDIGGGDYARPYCKPLPEDCFLGEVVTRYQGFTNPPGLEGFLRWHTQTRGNEGLGNRSGLPLEYDGFRQGGYPDGTFPHEGVSPGTGRGERVDLLHWGGGHKTVVAQLGRTRATDTFTLVQSYVTRFPDLEDVLATHPEGWLSFEARSVPRGFEEYFVWRNEEYHGMVRPDPEWGTGAAFVTFQQPTGTQAWNRVWVAGSQFVAEGGPPQLLALLEALRPDPTPTSDGMLLPPLSHKKLLDINNDGREDVVFQRFGTARIAWAYQDATGAFDLDFDQHLDLPDATSFRLHDRNQDGTTDLVVLRETDQVVEVYHGQGGSFSSTANETYATGQPGQDLEFLDLDGVGGTDLVTIDGPGRSATLHRASAGFASQPLALASHPIQILSAAALNLASRGALLICSHPNAVLHVQMSGGAPQVADLTSLFSGIATAPAIRAVQPLALVVGQPAVDLAFFTGDLLAEQFQLDLYTRQGSLYNLRSSTASDGTETWFFPDDMNGDGFTDLVLARLNPVSGSAAWERLPGSASGFTGSVAVPSNSSLDLALHRWQCLRTPIPKLHDAILRQISGVRPKNALQLQPGDSFRDKLEEIILCLKSFAAYLSADGDTSNDPFAEKLDEVACDLLEKLTVSQQIYVAQCLGIVNGFTTFPHHLIVLNDRYLLAACDWRDPLFQQLVGTLFHEGVHAGCNTKLELVATFNTIRLLEELLKDSIDDECEFDPASFLGGKIQVGGGVLPDGMTFKDDLQEQKWGEKLYQLHVAFPFNVLHYLALAIIDSWDGNYPPVPPPPPGNTLGPSPLEFTVLKALIELVFGVSIDFEVDYPSEGSAGRITVKWTIDYCGHQGTYQQKYKVP